MSEGRRTGNEERGLALPKGVAQRIKSDDRLACSRPAFNKNDRFAAASDGVSEHADNASLSRDLLIKHREDILFTNESCGALNKQSRRPESFPLNPFQDLSPSSVTNPYFQETGERL